MSLTEKIKERQCRSEVVEIDGIKFRVSGKTKRERGEIFAKARKSKGDFASLENMMLEACVSDPDDGSRATAAEWSDTPSHITGPLFGIVMQFNGMDADDVKREDPKE